MQIFFSVRPADEPAEAQDVLRPGGVLQAGGGPPVSYLRALDFLTEESLLVGYSPASEDCEETLPSGNVGHRGLHEPAQARLKLYEEMEKLGDRVLYTDTGRF